MNYTLLHRQNGRCEPYLGPGPDNRTILCDSVYTPGVDYVYIPSNRAFGMQARLRFNLFETAASLSFVNLSNPLCLQSLIRGLCVHYYLPCGSNSSIHVPEFLCADACRYLADDVCKSVWPIAVQQLKLVTQAEALGLNLPVCDNPSLSVAFLNLSSDCCRDGGILPNPTTTITTLPSTTSSSQTPLMSGTPQTLPTTIIIASATVGGAVAILTILCIITCLVLLLCWRKKRATGPKKVNVIRYGCSKIFCYNDFLLHPNMDHSDRIYGENCHYYLPIIIK